MRLGFLTDCVPQWPLDVVVRWAADHGFETVEVAAWPTANRGHATHIDVARFDRAAADRVGELLAAAGVGISAVSCYDNLLGADGGAVRDHLVACCEAAHMLGVDVVGMFVGRNPGRTIREDVAAAERILPALVDDASSRGVTLAVENCPMPQWHPDRDPGNLAYSPELWGWLAGIGIGLNYDPSHLPPLGIDPVAALRDAEHVVHVQAKDVETSPEARNRTGYREPVFDEAHGWWRYRTPGRGSLDWARIVDALRARGFDGTVAVEHEDPVLGASPEGVAAGLRAARDVLAPLL